MPKEYTIPITLNNVGLGIGLVLYHTITALLWYGFVWAIIYQPVGLILVGCAMFAKIVITAILAEDMSERTFGFVMFDWIAIWKTIWCIKNYIKHSTPIKVHFKK